MIVLIRADISPQIGAGHVMRCLSLAQRCCAEGVRVLFALAETSVAFEERVRTEGHQVIRLSVARGGDDDALETTRLAEAHDVSWIVADGYSFGSGWQEQVKRIGRRLLVFADGATPEARHYDFLLNPDGLAATFPRNGTSVFGGPRYVLLRQEFCRWRDWSRTSRKGIEKLLISFGATDQHDLTTQVLSKLEGVEGIRITVVVGSENPRASRIAQYAEQRSQTIQLIIDSENMAALMAENDLAITAAGSTCWELAFMGLPALAFVAAANQTGVARLLTESGSAIVFDEIGAGVQAVRSLIERLADLQARERMSKAGRVLVDGFGAERVLTHMRGALLDIRRAALADCELLWHWANEPEVRRASFNNEEIPWSEHLLWFQERISSKMHMLQVVHTRDEGAIGIVRFDCTGGIWVVSITIAASHRGRGYGAAALSRATRFFFRAVEAEEVFGYIKSDNEASINCFRKADYDHVSQTTIRGLQAQIFRACKRHDCINRF
jgi:UDP-2,4-diacetamido-2,4,6-trideoxy-beta-L-altropyranose hydrolase